MVVLAALGNIISKNGSAYPPVPVRHKILWIREGQPGLAKSKGQVNTCTQSEPSVSFLRMAINIT